MDLLVLLKNILKDNYCIEEGIDIDTNLLNDLGFDSISIMELALELKKNINKSIPHNTVTAWTTVQSIINSLQTL